MKKENEIDIDFKNFTGFMSGIDFALMILRNNPDKSPEGIKKCLTKVKNSILEATGAFEMTMKTNPDENKSN